MVTTESISNLRGAFYDLKVIQTHMSYCFLVKIHRLANSKHGVHWQETKVHFVLGIANMNLVAVPLNKLPSIRDAEKTPRSSVDQFAVVQHSANGQLAGD